MIVLDAFAHVCSLLTRAIKHRKEQYFISFRFLSFYCYSSLKFISRSSVIKSWIEFSCRAYAKCTFCFLSQMVLECFVPPRCFLNFALNALNFCELHTYNRNYSAKSIVFLILFLLAFSEAADENTAGGSVPPAFKGTRSHFNVWYTAFCGWLAMKYPDLIALVQEELEEPDEPAAGAAVEEVAAFKEYWNLQKRLYGTLIAAVWPAPA